eukprot:COSAG04_NODE_323_length_16882_cov_5.975627_28_plen_164_part_00
MQRRFSSPVTSHSARHSPKPNSPRHFKTLHFLLIGETLKSVSSGKVGRARTKTTAWPSKGMTAAAAKTRVTAMSGTRNLSSQTRAANVRGLASLLRKAGRDAEAEKTATTKQRLRGRYQLLSKPGVMVSTTLVSTAYLSVARSLPATTPPEFAAASSSEVGLA